MRYLPALVVLLTSALSAQSTLTTAYNTNAFLNSHDGGVYFDLVTHRDLRLERLDLNLFENVGTRGTLEVWLRPDTWQGQVDRRGDWMRVGHGTMSAAGAQQATPCQLSQPIELPAGRYGVALKYNGCKPIYQSALWPRRHANADLEILSGGSAMRFLETTPYVVRVFSGALHYSLGGGPGALAAVERYGQGCTQGARSFHETFAPGTFDLTNQRLTLTPNGSGGYDVARSRAPAITLPTGARNLDLARHGAAFVQLPQPLTFPGGSTPTLLALADGRVMFTNAGLLGTPSAPAASAMLTGKASVAVGWDDLAPEAGGNVYTATELNGTTRIIWWRVPHHQAPSSTRTFEFVVRPNGTLELAWDGSGNPTTTTVVGFGAGHGARDPGPRDLSGAPNFSTQHDDPGLELIPVGRPVLGCSPTNDGARIEITGTRASAVGQLVLFSWREHSPGIAFGGNTAPGCELHIDPNGMVAAGLGTGTTLPLTLPRHPALLGVRFATQAASWSPGANPLGILVSNAARWTIGSI
ncbi:MAG: hypothetical protein NXI31_19490 [bacterium]|nr:hypothetical protein [bacterium]